MAIRSSKSHHRQDQGQLSEAKANAVPRGVCPNQEQLLKVYSRTALWQPAVSAVVLVSRAGRADAQVHLQPGGLELGYKTVATTMKKARMTISRGHRLRVDSRGVDFAGGSADEPLT